MSIICDDIAGFMEEFAPTFLAEDWDNVGLLVGSRSQEVRRVLVCLEVSAKVVEEAVSKKIDLILSHHPMIFKGLKRIVADDFSGGLLYKLIRNNIGVYSAHTNLDVTDHGINEHLADIMGLKNAKNLNPYQSEDLYKVVVFVPERDVDRVREAMCSAGAGWLGNYSDCTFMTKGTGTFKPLEGTHPYIGTQGTLEKVDEYRLETVVPKSRMGCVISAMLKAHPYEEVAYDTYLLKLKGKEYGLGKYGSLEVPMSFDAFVRHVKNKLNISTVRLIGQPPKEVQTAAVFCGAFDDNFSAVVRNRIDVLIAGDVKHHTAFDMAAAGICVIDAGHFATERIMVPHLTEILSKKFPELEVIASEVEEDPIKTC